MLQVAINVEDTAWQALATDIEATCQDVLHQAWAFLDIDAQTPWLSLLLAGDSELQALNLQFRGQDKPTNVLSFPSPDAVAAGEDSLDVLGDIALSCETIQREADEQGKKVAHHLTHLLVHGLLHLLGYDHEQDDDAATMEQLEIDILGEMGLANPYELA
jgi:probable rRNA maturation factor